MDDRLARLVNIENIVLRSLKAETALPPGPLASEVRLMVSHAGSASVVDRDLVEVTVAFTIREDSTIPRVKVDAEFVLKYRVPDDCNPTQAELDQFAQTNGVFSAWPYLRELSGSVFARMQLPFGPLPVFRIPAGMASVQAAKKSAKR
jgi:hypothetical protein